MMKKVLTATLLLGITLFSVACTADGTAFNAELGIPEENVVFAKPDDVRDTAHFYPKVNPKTGYADAALIDVSSVDGFAKDLIVGFFGEGVDKIVMTEAKYLVEDVDLTGVFQPIPTKIDEETGKPAFDGATAANTLGGAVGAAFPGAAPFVPFALYLVGLLSKRRSRQHLGNMAKSVIPYDGKIDIGGAYASGKKAIGLEHSTEDPDELIAVAEKKKAVLHAKNGGQAAMAAAYDAEKEAA